MLYPEAKLILFSKAPLPGASKTRLISSLGEMGAAQLQQRMTQHMVTTVFAAGFSNIALQCYPDSSHASFMQLLDQHCIEMNAQRGNHLGERMAHAMLQALQQHRYVIIIGTDAPAIDQAYISSAIEQLAAGNDAVIGPAEDGGYVLLGLSRYAANIFDNIDWGSDRVLQQTLQAMQQSQMSVHTLNTLWDVDRPDDLHRLAADARLSDLLDGLG